MTTKRTYDPYNLGGMVINYNRNVEIPRDSFAAPDGYSQNKPHTMTATLPASVIGGGGPDVRRRSDARSDGERQNPQRSWVHAQTAGVHGSDDDLTVEHYGGLILDLLRPKVCECETRPGVFWAGYWSEEKWAISDQGEYHPGCVDGETYITFCPYCGHNLPETP